MSPPKPRGARAAAAKKAYVFDLGSDEEGGGGGGDDDESEFEEDDD